MTQKPDEPLRLYIFRYLKIHKSVTKRDACYDTNPSRWFRFLTSITNTTIADKITQSQFLPQNLQQCFKKALRLEASLQLSEGVNMACKTTVMNVEVDANDDNLVATTPIMAKAMKNLYAKLNRHKDLKRSYRRKYKDLQAMVTTTTDPPVTLPQPVIATSNKVNPSPQVLKATLKGQGKKSSDKGKGIKPLEKGKKNVVKTTTSATTSASPSANLRSNFWDKAKHTAALTQEIMEELQAIEEESLKDKHDSEATQESDLE